MVVSIYNPPILVPASGAVSQSGACEAPDRQCGRHNAIADSMHGSKADYEWMVHPMPRKT